MIFGKSKLVRAHDCYLNRESLEKREKWYVIGVIGSMAVTGALQFAHSNLQVADMDEALTIGRDIAGGIALGFAIFGTRSNYQQGAAKEYPRLVAEEFEAVMGYLASSPDAAENRQLLELDSTFTELCGSTPLTTEDLG